MRHRHVMAVHRIMMRGRPASIRPRARMDMRDDLVPIEIEVDPFVRTAPLRTAEQIAVKGARGDKIMDRKGQVQGPDASHIAMLP
jgi:hypothetical protein